jgi:hypothetical protein
VLLYFQELNQDILNCFNLNKALKFLDLKGIKYSININGLIPYNPLYNLLKFN